LARKLFRIEGLPQCWEAEDAGHTWNGWSVPLLNWAQCDEVFRAIGEVPPEPFEGMKPVDGLCWVELLMPRKGDVVKFNAPSDEEEARERFILLEAPEAGRVLVECVTNLPIRPSKVLRLADLELARD
jgi:hypothetical protein